jgi:hypothetical protein
MGGAFSLFSLMSEVYRLAVWIKGRESGWKREAREYGGRERALTPDVLFLNNCFDRAYLGTVSAFGTFLFIDDVGFSLLNRFCGAFFRTRSASHAFIGDHIGHSHHPLYP